MQSQALTVISTDFVSLLYRFWRQYPNGAIIRIFINAVKGFYSHCKEISGKSNIKTEMIRTIQQYPLMRKNNRDQNTCLK